MPLSSLSVVVRVLPVPVGPTHNTWARREVREGRERKRKEERCHLHMYPMQQQQKTYTGDMVCSLIPRPHRRRETFLFFHAAWNWNMVRSLEPRSCGRTATILSFHVAWVLDYTACWVQGYTACSSSSYRLGVCDEQLQHKMGTGGVDGGDDNVGESCVGVHHKRWHPLHPAHPLDLVK